MVRLWDNRYLPNPGSVGFTGTRDRPTRAQMESLRDLLLRLRLEQKLYEFHHGDCVGADEMAHKLVVRYGRSEIIVHPPDNDRYRAHCLPSLGNGTILQPLPYLERNRNIVDSTQLLIAVPKGPQSKLPRSGTWSTVRYAESLKRPIYIIHPSGLVETQPNN